MDFCFIAIYLFLALAVGGIVLEVLYKVEYLYQEGSRSLSPFGLMIVHVRDQKNGEWKRAAEFRNPYEVIKEGRKKTYDFLYNKESNWVEAAVEHARSLLPDNKDVSVDYRHETTETVRTFELWRNNEWK